jgi:DNA-binding GntR family transcriptional regulator
MKLQRNSLREQVRDSLLAKISRGELKPGDRIVEARLVEELHASNIPVREAIRELVAKRVLDSAPHKGAWVRQPSIPESIEAFKVRAILDAGAARMAIDELRGNCDHLRRAAEGTAQAVEKEDFLKFVRYNRDLHRGIIEATRNDCLLRTWDAVNVEIHGLFARGSLEPFDVGTIVDDHMAIVEALNLGDAEEGASLLTLHANRIVESLCQARTNEQPTEPISQQS